MNATNHRVRWATTTLAVMAVLFATGCSFSRHWSKAGTQPTPANDIAGRWEGTWQSDVTGHHGKLRSIATPLTTDSYRFDYWAQYKIMGFLPLSGSYTITQAVQRVDGTFRMTGGSDLPKMFGGRFEYEGKATPTNFFSTYRSKSDNGSFQMKRPQ